MAGRASTWLGEGSDDGCGMSQAGPDSERPAVVNDPRGRPEPEPANVIDRAVPWAEGNDADWFRAPGVIDDANAEQDTDGPELSHPKGSPQSFQPPGPAAAADVNDNDESPQRNNRWNRRLPRFDPKAAVELLLQEMEWAQSECEDAWGGNEHHLVPRLKAWQEQLWELRRFLEEILLSHCHSLS